MRVGLTRETWKRIGHHWRWLFASLLLTASLAYALAPLVQFRPWSDVSFVAAAGRTWLKGISPYQFEHWNLEWEAIRPRAWPISQPMPFVYPPYWAPIAVVLGALPWPLASGLWDLVNLATFSCVCALSISLLGLGFRRALDRPVVWVMVALATFAPAYHHTIWHAQLTVVPTLGIVGSFWAHARQRPGWLVCFALLAALKPQLAFLPLLYLFLNGAQRELAIAAAIAVVVTVLAMLPSGLARMPSDLARCYGLHTQLDFNSPEKFFHVPSLAAKLAPRASLLAGPVLGALAVGALSYLRRRHPDWANGLLQRPLGTLALVMVISVALMPLHLYDLVILAPLLLYAHELRRDWLGWLMVGIAMLASRPATLTGLLGVGLAQPLVTGALLVSFLVAARYVNPTRAEPELAT